jgi:uncharacterized membrane protein YfcA
MPPELLVVGAVAVGAAAQAATGMGFSLVAAPALVAALGPRQGVGTVLLLAVLASLVPLSRDWRHARPHDALRLLVPTLACTPLVALALRSADTSRVAIAAGLGVLAGVALLASGVRWAWLRRRRGAVVAGLGSAVLNVVGGVGGPPIGLYAANADWGPRQTRGTLSVFFLVQNLVTAVVVGLTLPHWPTLVALVVGVTTGMVLAPRLPAAALRTTVLLVSAVGGLALVAGSV